ncbi:LysR family transcriptional regulator [Quadrisphaera granulorum]|uniref:LysR family transcriptional regulator n=1 Tax=Quadrisphaera granulorum TaxID=317664 RepID=UPI000D6D36AD|nr:LysR family transcriptional regulator [Quadrisphaera granulorum]
MELRTLAYFVATADCGTVSAAAERVHVTQPSLSRQLRGLEEQLGVELFDRSGRRLEITPVGRTLLPRARALLTDAEALRAAAQLHACGALEQVTLAAPATTLTDIVSPFLATLAPEDPVPSVVESGGATAEESLRRGADLAIVAGRPPRTVASRAMPPLPIWAYLPPGHAWSGREEVTVEELLTESLISLPPSHSARRALDAAVVTTGLAAPPLLETANGTVAQALCAAGRGVAVLSDDARFGLDRVGLLLGSEHLSVRLHCAWDPTHPAAPVLADLAARISAWVVERYVTAPDPA